APAPQSGSHPRRRGAPWAGPPRLGEAAWAIEQTMNAWLQDERAATPPLLQLLAMAHEYFSENVRRLKDGGSSSDERPLVAAAERVRRGELPERALVPGAPVQAGAGPAGDPLLELAPDAGAGADCPRAVLR